MVTKAPILGHQQYSGTYCLESKAVLALLSQAVSSPTTVESVHGVSTCSSVWSFQEQL